jgi:nucleoside-diphosphate-sugar epimerase
MRVLVTGHCGYIGAVLVSVLRHARFEVVGLDCDFFRGCNFGRVRPSVPSYDMDLRDVEFTDLLSFDAVVHLAMVPAESVEASAGPRINEEATTRLVECCHRADVGRLVMASSCEVYGHSRTGVADETSRCSPITPGGCSSLACERAARAAAGDGKALVILRQAVVLGTSPRLRLDTPVNGMVASAVSEGAVSVAGDGGAYCPVVHVEDLARAYAAVLAAPDDGVAGETFNIVSPDGNVRTVDLADAIVECVPGSTRSLGRYRPDEPRYLVNGNKFCSVFPQFSCRWTLHRGIRQLVDAMRGAGLTPADRRSGRFYRAARIATLRRRGRLDESLRPTRRHLASASS